MNQTVCYKQVLGRLWPGSRRLPRDNDSAQAALRVWSNETFRTTFKTEPFWIPRSTVHKGEWRKNSRHLKACAMETSAGRTIAKWCKMGNYQCTNASEQVQSEKMWKASITKDPSITYSSFCRRPTRVWRRTDRPNNLDPSMSLLTLAHLAQRPRNADQSYMYNIYIYPSYPSNYLIISLLSICIYLSYLVIWITGHCVDKRRIETKETPTIFWNLLPVWVHHHSILDSQNMFRVTIIPHSIETILLQYIQAILLYTSSHYLMIISQSVHFFDPEKIS